MKPNAVLAYACDFTGFLIQKLPSADLKRVRAVLLFGSAARLEATSESDVDIVIDAPESKEFVEKVRRIVESFEDSVKVKMYWKPLGIELPINVQVGIARGSVVPGALREHGKVLYGPYTPTEPGQTPYALISWDPVGDQRRRTNLYRNLFGYSSHGNHYPGLLKENAGVKLSSRSILIPVQAMETFKQVFIKWQVVHRIRVISEYEL